jgi:hypothetical protein
MQRRGLTRRLTKRALSLALPQHRDEKDNSLESQIVTKEIQQAQSKLPKVLSRKAPLAC